jgi:hypothetical protein
MKLRDNMDPLEQFEQEKKYSKTATILLEGESAV